MQLQAKVKFIRKKLKELFPNPLPSLQSYSPYTLLIAVLLSANSRDKKVNEVTPLLFNLADTAEKMVLLSVEEIQQIIRCCGLSKFKANAIKELSLILLSKYQGKVPNDLEKLEELPGVGHKTASVVISQAFKIPAFPVDTHIYRLARKWGLSQAKQVTQVEKDLKNLFPKKEWNTLHLQLIYYARNFCPSRGHLLKNCEICRHFAL